MFNKSLFCLSTAPHGLHQWRELTQMSPTWQSLQRHMIACGRMWGWHHCVFSLTHLLMRTLRCGWKLLLHKRGNFLQSVCFFLQKSHRFLHNLFKVLILIIMWCWWAILLSITLFVCPKLYLHTIQTCSPSKMTCRPKLCLDSCNITTLFSKSGIFFKEQTSILKNDKFRIEKQSSRFMLITYRQCPTN